jgi:hypothetical protein
LINAKITEQLRDDTLSLVLSSSIQNGTVHIDKLKDWIIAIAQNPNIVFTEPLTGKQLLMGLMNWYLSLTQTWDGVLAANTQ